MQDLTVQYNVRIVDLLRLSTRESYNTTPCFPLMPKDRSGLNEIRSSESSTLYVQDAVKPYTTGYTIGRPSPEAMIAMLQQKP